MFAAFTVLHQPEGLVQIRVHSVDGKVKDQCAVLELGGIQPEPEFLHAQPVTLGLFVLVDAEQEAVSPEVCGRAVGGKGQRHGRRAVEALAGRSCGIGVAEGVTCFTAGHVKNIVRLEQAVLGQIFHIPDGFGLFRAACCGSRGCQCRHQSCQQSDDQHHRQQGKRVSLAHEKNLLCVRSRTFFHKCCLDYTTRRGKVSFRFFCICHTKARMELFPPRRESRFTPAGGSPDSQRHC